jgi:hypothetical protein
MLTVTCPCWVVKVRVSPLISANVPLAPRRWNWADWVVVIDGGAVISVEVDVVVEDAEEHATAITDKVVARTNPALIGIIFLIFIFIYFYLL